MMPRDRDVVEKEVAVGTAADCEHVGVEVDDLPFTPTPERTSSMVAALLP